ncbi:MAG TPA: DUF5668 domain-containing protein [Candidatus Dormibacteraeota bacterium]|nr:DUF5668 domain-containing protein [Candidatus Dormibacteraeota bacterium]
MPPSTGATWTDARAERRAARRAAKAERRGYGDPTAGLIFGGILVLLGIYFLAQQYIPELDLGRFWPVLVIAVGVVLVGRALYRPGSGR